jgi:hypothetical protein
MGDGCMKVLRVFDKRPTMIQAEAIGTIGPIAFEVPADWEIWNAPRPMLGNAFWLGEFRHGVLYAALDPADRDAAAWRQRNVDHDGRLVEYVDRATMVAEWQGDMAEEYGAGCLDGLEQREQDGIFDAWWAERREVER